MKRLFNITALAAVAVLLTGCLDGPNSGNSARPAASVDFTAFVQAQFKATSNTTEPAAINGIDFRFNDQNNEQAFDSLVP